MSRNVLLTGGAGFIGHHIVDHIIHNTDWKITTLDRLDYSGNLNLNRLHEILEKYTPDQRKRVNIVFHDLKADINNHTANIDYIRICTDTPCFNPNVTPEESNIFIIR